MSLLIYNKDHDDNIILIPIRDHTLFILKVDDRFGIWVKVKNSAPGD